MVKVGDRVQIDEVSSMYHGHCGVVVRDNKSGILPFRVSFDGGDWSVYEAENLIVLSTEEETSVKFKVGDKVKVSNSWDGHNGEVGEITRRNIWDVCPWRVEFEDAGQESFREEELELVKEKAEKQSFTKSDLKTGMGVVLRNGRRGHVLVDTGCVDIIRFLENGNYSCLNDFSDDLTSNYKQQCDIAEVYFTEYQFKLFTEGVFEQDCVFKREVIPTKMTMKEINEHFGKPIEIVE